ncbi:hypothetical protein Nepgr_014429 [Nepenthes gracilis]|uniref:Glutamate receptor n=1 Tax=Nepenthes gracilis TaxID=150966 RepID=A0AAD3SJD6_NEPGR|nr:hypothetical protein Nepgr_014429 [Nepenthes gracilis]
MRLLLPILLLLVYSVHCERVPVVKIGAIFAYNSVIGRVAKPAMELAVHDVNEDPSILNGTDLKLITEDANCSVFMGSISAFQLLEKEVVAIIGPQSSAVAHMISAIANAVRVPLVSYAATDPTLSALQFPFFLRTTQSDSYQMAAMADLIDFYGWKEVISIFVDDEYGRNGISALSDELEKRRINISYKLPLGTQFDFNTVTDLLNKSKFLGPRVFVVHVNPDPNFRIFRVAQSLQMMDHNYVWLATDWLSATLDSIATNNDTLLSTLQGVVGLRHHTQESSQRKAFFSRWRSMQQKNATNCGLNTFGLNAYDTVWAIARSIDELLNQSHNGTFSFSSKLWNINRTNLHLDELKVFDGGDLLLKQLLQTNFSGLSGRIQFHSDRNLASGGYEVINVDQMAVKIVGYWSNSSGLSVLPPEALKQEQHDYSFVNQNLKNVVWPGGKTENPRGWVISNDGRPLRIGVPRRVSFVEFVTVFSNTSEVEGYCIDVFNEARKLVPYEIPYEFQPFGDGLSNPSYNELVRMVADDVLDAAVGDIAIVMDRTKFVDFTQPYAATGLVILAPTNNKKSRTWVFLRPFTVQMWCATAGSLVFMGIVMWILERRVNDYFQGPPKRQIIKVLLYSISILLKTSKENTMSALGRMVMVLWLFLFLVITASYTASLTSILTVEQLSSPITGIESLVASNWPIGYQVGSFSYGYLRDNLDIRQSRLVALGNQREYEQALRRGPSHGGVAAIIDELPYIELFLSNHTDFGIVGQAFTKGGWGFAFKRGSPLAVDMSTAVLKLSENGKLQQIHDKWFCKMGCPGARNGESKPNELHLSSFVGLYVLCGISALAAFLVFMLRVSCQYLRFRQKRIDSSNSSSPAPSSDTRCSQVLINFLDFIDKKEEAVKSLFKKAENSQAEVI